jgi:uncharacterized phage protein gp47/JayE
MANEVTIKTFETIYAEFKADLTALGSVIQNANPGGAYDLLIRLTCRVIADLNITLENALAQAFLATATGDWLDLKAQELGTARKTATKTIKEFTLRRTSTTGVLQIPIGDIIKSPVIPERGQLRFFSIISTEPVLAAASLAGEFPNGVGEITVRFEAEDPGTNYNNIELLLDQATVVFEIESGLTGVDEVESTGQDLVPGINDETDDELRARLLTRWAELAAGATREAYRQFAINSSDSVYDANVSDTKPGGQPTDVQVVLSGPPGSRALTLGTKVDAANNFDPLYTDDGLVTGNSTIATTIHEYIRERMPLTDFLYLTTVTETPQDLEVNIVLADGFEETVTKDLVEQRLQALFIVEQDVTDVTVLAVGEDLLFSELTRIMNNTPGVADWDWITPAPGADIAVALDEVLTLGTITVGDKT